MLHSTTVAKLKSLALPSSILILSACGGCYINRAMWDPWSYAPPNSSSFWHPPARAISKGAPLTPVVPTQEMPFSLAEVIDIALNNSPSTQLTWAQARTAAAQYAQSQSTDLPTFTGSFTYERLRNPITTTSTAFTGGSSASSSGLPSSTTAGGTGGGIQNFYLTQWGPQLQVSYTLWDFGQQRATSESARQALYFADWTHNRNIQTLIETITEDYYNYLYQKQLLAADIADLQTAQTTLDATIVGLETGVKDVSDYLQARTQMLQAEITLVSQKENVETAYAQLLNDMGLPANLKFTMQDFPLVDPDEEFLQSADELLEIAKRERADLLAAKAELESKEQALKAAKSEYWPTLDYNFNIGRTYFNGGRNDNYDFESTFSLTFPIFSGYYYRNNVRIAQANKEQSKANLFQTELAIVQQVTTAHYNVKIAFETLKYAKAYLQSAEEQYQVSLSKYRAGTSTIVDVVSAQSSLADARAKQASALQQWFTSLTTLTYATGTLYPQNVQGEEEGS